MSADLSAHQAAARAEFEAFASREVAPRAAELDRAGAVPGELVQSLGRRGYLGALAPRADGGLGLDMIGYGLLHEAIGRACSSVRSLLTVHGMVLHALLKWGSAAQQRRYAPTLARGERLGAFCLTEPEAGSDATHIATVATPAGDGFVVSGTKRWIAFGQLADVLLVFALVGDRPIALLIERDTPGLQVIPIVGLLGLRAAMLAELRFERCHVPRENLLGGLGFGLATVAASALDLGRYSAAWGCVGIGQACLDASLAYVSRRRQLGHELGEQPLVRRLITNMITAVKAARLLCCHAGQLKDAGDPQTVMDTCVAKYFAAGMAMRVASDAVQVHGANGMSGELPVERYLRDAKIMQLVEGSTELQQGLIADYGLREWSSRVVPDGGSWA